MGGSLLFRMPLLGKGHRGGVDQEGTSGCGERAFDGREKGTVKKKNAHHSQRLGVKKGGGPGLKKGRGRILTSNVLGRKPCGGRGSEGGKDFTISRKGKHKSA